MPRAAEDIHLRCLCIRSAADHNWITKLIHFVGKKRNFFNFSRSQKKRATTKTLGNCPTLPEYNYNP